jgi:hypothetical protein
MKDAFRVGAGQLLLCDKDSLYKTENALKNPRFDILIGRSIDPRFPNDTAFQFESCRMNDLTNFVLHGLVFFEYKRVRKNVGAFGYSVFTDKEPLVISTCGGQICPHFSSKRDYLYKVDLSLPEVEIPDVINETEEEPKDDPIFFI